MLCALALAALLPRAAAAVVSLPTGFTVEDAVPGAGFLVPTSLAFLPDGRMLVTEKRGRVYLVENGVKHPAPLWARENEVLDSDDRGLLCVAVDPHYFVNHYIYLLYTVDPDSNGVETDSDGFGRLTRYQVSSADSNVVDSSTRTILMGVDWRHGPLIASPSHTIGALRWGNDGSLLVSAGDGAQFNGMDQGGQDAAAFGANQTDPYEDIGAFRSQYIGCLPGKLLRLDPATGLGYPGNPYYDGNGGAPRSKVWAYGLRNPFRFTVKPGTGSANPADAQPGTIYLGDVGWDTWEEMNVVKTPGQNFGWPCYEGAGASIAYPLGNPSHGGCDSIGTAWNPAQVSPPLATWNHYDSNLGTPPGFTGNTSIGGAFYTGGFYPAGYYKRYFFGDYGQNWIKVLVADTTDQLIDILPFADDADGPVDFATDPVSGDLFYVSITTFQVRRIRWAGGVAGDTPPVAKASAFPLVGVPPLDVQFSSAGTYDLDGDPIIYNWLFGDGQGSTAPDPSHVYAATGDYLAVLTVDDGLGGIGKDSVVVRVSPSFHFPSTGILDDFNRADGPVGGAWVDDTAGLAIADSALILTTGSATTVWSDAVFDPVQEAYFTLAAVTASAPEQNLMLKVQSLIWSGGHIEVKYDAIQSLVAVSTYAPGEGWVGRGTIAPVTLQAGDQFGARAEADGTVEVYRNGALLGTVSVAGWEFASGGGRVGMTLAVANASRIDNFGGGTFVPAVNTPPAASILSPADSFFYAAPETLQLKGAATDAEDPPDSLLYHWSVRLHHNNHVHFPLETGGDSTELITLDHDDGTGVYFEIRLYVTDKGGLVDTAIVNIFPEADLEPSSVTVMPGSPGASGSAQYRFELYNHGRLPAHISHWQLVANATALAEGDTIVAALDSVRIVRIIPQALPAGRYDLRVVADTLRSVVETDEANNARTQPLTVVESSVGVADVPARLALSPVFPSPSAGAVSLVLELPRAANVAFAVYDVNGRQIHSDSGHPLAAGRWTLSWPGKSQGGALARPGIYLARVSVNGSVFARRFAVVR